MVIVNFILLEHRKIWSIHGLNMSTSVFVWSDSFVGWCDEFQRMVKMINFAMIADGNSPHLSIWTQPQSPLIPPWLSPAPRKSYLNKCQLFLYRIRSFGSVNLWWSGIIFMYLHIYKSISPYIVIPPLPRNSIFLPPWPPLCCCCWPSIIPFFLTNSIEILRSSSSWPPALYHRNHRNHRNRRNHPNWVPVRQEVAQRANITTTQSLLSSVPQLFPSFQLVISLFILLCHRSRKIKSWLMLLPGL